MDDEKRKFSLKMYLIVPLLLVILILSVSFALFSKTLFGTKEYMIRSSGLSIRLDESETENISLENVIPVSDEAGLQNTPYIFSLVNEEKEDLAYTIYLKEKKLENKTPASAIRYNYTRDVEDIDVTRNIDEQKTEDGRFYLETGVIPAHNTYRYAFRMWIDLAAGNEILNTEYSIQLEIEALQITTLYQEDVLHGTDPVLTDHLIPVIIENDGTVKKASVYKEWYRYANQEWANAVVLEDQKQKYNPGDVIPNDSIESYFVWIPRYKYKIFNEGKDTGLTSFENRVQTIEVEFENKNQEVSKGSTVGSWLSHPAFQAFDSNGFWVGKFEPGYRDARTTEEAQVNSTDFEKLVIRPNEFSWRGNSLGNAFKVSYDYLRSDESHMIKNTEWGAVSYLQHSVFGSRQSVRINNNTDFKTGYAAVSEPTTYEGEAEGNPIGTDLSVTQPYYTTIGYTASTTGNITGIYDMSGGAHEYVMGYNLDASVVGGESGITGIYGDFFTDSRWDKYYDKYRNPTDSSTVYNIGILGDATSEMGPFGSGKTGYHSSWYSDFTLSVFNDSPWYLRGGGAVQGISAGIFHTTRNNGAFAFNVISFRVVLTPR